MSVDTFDFEHIVQVNDPANPQIADITRSQLWQGLVLRARCPQRFLEGIDCHSHPENDSCFVREIRAGESNFYEDVTLEHESRILTETHKDKPQIYAASEASIEEPEEGYLFVRFRYCREMPEANANVDIAEHLKAAYRQLDTDAISLIRIMAEDDSFHSSIN